MDIGLELRLNWEMGLKVKTYIRVMKENLEVVLYIIPSYYKIFTEFKVRNLGYKGQSGFRNLH